MKADRFQMPRTFQNVLTVFSLAGFQVTSIGRIWVTAEGAAIQWK